MDLTLRLELNYIIEMEFRNDNSSKGLSSVYYEAFDRQTARYFIQSRQVIICSSNCVSKDNILMKFQ